MPLLLHNTYVGISEEIYLTSCDLILLAYIKVFRVTEFKSGVGFSKFKMVDPIWWT